MLGERLREIRERQGLSQTDLAKLCGLGPKQVWRYENGESSPTEEHLSRIADQLGVSMDYLSGRTDEPGGIYSAAELTDSEVQVIKAVRRGAIVEALKGLTEIAESHQQSGVASTDEVIHNQS